MQRYWLLGGGLVTSAELKARKISPLRTYPLGKFATVEAAAAKAREQFTAAPDVAWVIAHNVRIACDSGLGARYGLTAEQIERLRAGESITMHDSLGDFGFAYTMYGFPPARE